MSAISRLEQRVEKTNDIEKDVDGGEFYELISWAKPYDKIFNK